MLRLVKIEWLKLTHQTTTWILALLLLGISGLFPLISMTNVLGNSSLSFRQDSYTRLNFMEGSLSILSGLSSLGIILAAVMVGTVIGSEFGLDTWKNLLTWQNGRMRFLAVKLALTGVTLLLGLTLSIFLSGLFASIGHALVARSAAKDGLKENPITYDQFTHNLVVSGLPLILYLVIATSLTTLFTILGRSTIVGIMVTLVWWTGEILSMRLLPDFLQNATVLGNITSFRQNLTDGTGSVSTWQSLVVLAVYFIVPLVIALVVFQRRDITA